MKLILFLSFIFTALSFEGLASQNKKEFVTQDCPSPNLPIELINSVALKLKKFEKKYLGLFRSKEDKEGYLQVEFIPKSPAQGKIHPLGDLPLPFDSYYRAYPKDSPWDIYYTGSEAETVFSDTPSAYRNYALNNPQLLAEAGEFPPQLKKIRLTEIEVQNKEITTEGHRQLMIFMNKYLNLNYNDLKSPPEFLGSGTFFNAFKICLKQKTKCYVLKFKKLATAGSSTLPLQDFIYNVYTHFKAKKLFSHIHYVSPEGEAMPFKVNGGPHRLKNGYPKKNLIRELELLDFNILQEGAILQEEAVWIPDQVFTHYSNEVAKIKSSKNLKHDLIQEIKSLGINYDSQKEKDLNKFLLMGSLPSATGPNLYKVTDFMKLCEKLKTIPFPAKVCASYRTSFNIPDDYFDRVLAIEQAFRDTAETAIRDRRANFGYDIINASRTKKFKQVEIGFDYLHGVNINWNQEEGLAAFHDQ